ncbi:DUF423 domain-containing protein [Sulfurospirillum sp. 1612]|uniref:DUF423 domain-containing protein n=1 Tax=Sulfurospirillum sp. 1612 TaxID=3094835 RepID=UPI002F94CEBC
MNELSRKFVFYGALFMALAVAIGAFGAHGLKQSLTKEMAVVYHTGVTYQFYHALGLFAVAFVAHFNPCKKVAWAGYLMIFGMVLFSCSLYALSITHIMWLGAITPIGGTGFIVAWILLAWGVKEKSFAKK